jgi:hypothetical protein
MLLKIQLEKGYSRVPIGAYGNYEAVKPTCVKKWLKDKIRSGQPKENSTTVVDDIDVKPTLPTRIIVYDEVFLTSHAISEKIFRAANFPMRHGVPHDLTNSQKTKLSDVTKELFQHQQNSPFIEQVLREDKKWICRTIDVV